METDASEISVCDVLVLKLHFRVGTAQYARRPHNSADRNYYAFERESMEFMFSLLNFRVYLLLSKPFNIFTDHQVLGYALEKKDFDGRLERGLKFLFEYDLQKVNRPGT